MERRFKLRISRMFRSCRSRYIRDIVQEPVFRRRDFHLLDSSPPKTRTLPFTCRPKSMKSINSCQEIYDQRRTWQMRGCIRSGDADGRWCPPASPASSLNSYYKSQNVERKQKKKRPMKQQRKNDKKEIIGTETIGRILARKSMKKNQSIKNRNKFIGDETVKMIPTSTTTSTDSRDLFSSDEKAEQETETLLSSDSSELRSLCRNSSTIDRRRKVCIRNSDVGFLSLGSVPPLRREKVRESVAVVKNSRDPYRDFRSSMVEMIIEKQIFGAKDLKQLLQCFLSLNSSHHHHIIVTVFLEIWEILFSN